SDYDVICLFFFFFQAEDGIRDRTVTGVQTCALPISGRRVIGHCPGLTWHTCDGAHQVCVKPIMESRSVGCKLQCAVSAALPRYALAHHLRTTSRSAMAGLRTNRFRLLRQDDTARDARLTLSEELLRAGVGWRADAVGRTILPADADSHAGYVLRSTGQVVVEDLTSERRFGSSPLLTSHGVVSSLSVLVHGKERPFGILGAHTPCR